MTDALTLQEITRQPACWQQAIDATGAVGDQICNHLRASGADTYLFTGCGTSFYLAIAAAGFFQELTGLTARAVPGSELILSPATYLPAGKKAALFAFSRSGETTETLVALRTHKEQGLGPTVGIVCRAGSPMSDVADYTVMLPSADDQSVVMTSSFTTMLLASVLIATQYGGKTPADLALDRLPALLEAQLKDEIAFGRQLGENADLKQFIFLGMGPFFGVACEGMLKLKEMTQVVCEAYSPLDFRHGPISVVVPGTLVTLIGSSRAASQESAVLADVAKLGGATLQLGGSAADSSTATYRYGVGEGLSEPARALLYTPLLQSLAYYRALAVNRDPDRPQHLTQVVKLDPASLSGK